MQGQFRFILAVIVIIACLSWGLKRHMKNAAEAAKAEQKAKEEKLDASTNSPAGQIATNTSTPMAPASTAGSANVQLSQQVQLQIQALSDILTAQITKQAEVNRKIDEQLKEISSGIGPGSGGGNLANPDPRVIQLEAMMQVIRARDLLGLSNRLQRVEVALTRLSADPAPTSNEAIQQTIDNQLKGIREDAAKNRKELESVRKQLDALKLKTSQVKPTAPSGHVQVNGSRIAPSTTGGTATALKIDPIRPR